MSDAANYDATMDASFNDVPKEVFFPEGTYELKLKNASIMKPREEGKSGKSIFVYTVSSPGDDVDPEKWAALDKAAVKNTEIIVDFWRSRPGDFRKIKEHVEKHDVGTEGKSNREVYAELKGTKVRAYLFTDSYESRDGDMVEVNRAKHFAKLN